MASIWAKCFLLAIGQLSDWGSAQPGQSAMETWKDGEGRDIQCGAQQPGVVREQELCAWGQFPLEGALGAVGTMLKIMGTFIEPHVNHSFGK